MFAMITAVAVEGLKVDDIFLISYNIPIFVKLLINLTMLHLLSDRLKKTLLRQ